jgi:hypothetical protein
MKIRPSVILFCLFIAGVIALLMWAGKRKTVETPLTDAPGTSPVQQMVTTPSPPASVPAPPIVPRMVPDTNLLTRTSMAEGKLAREIEVLSNYNDVLINFYGQLVDQFGTPVTGAEIDFTVRVINGYESTVNRGQVLSDANGLFGIIGYRGQDLSISPHKEGYMRATTGTLFKYSKLEEHPFVSYAYTPTIIKMWKLQGAEHLIHFHTEAPVQIDGTPAVFDLQTGEQVNSGGDIVVVVNSTPTPDVRSKYDWHVSIRAVNGGIIASSDDFEQMFAAPDTGYGPRLLQALFILRVEINPVTEKPRLKYSVTW